MAPSYASDTPIMRPLSAAFLVFVATTAWGKTCADAPCPIGQHGVIYSTRTDVAATCPTQALSDYANYVMSVASTSAGIGMTQPASPEELENQWTGASAAMVKSLRRNAGVSSVGEAIAKCRVTQRGEHVIVVASPIDDPNIFTMSIKVRPAAGGPPYWLPSTFVERIDQ